MINILYVAFQDVIKYAPLVKCFVSNGLGTDSE